MRGWPCGQKSRPESGSTPIRASATRQRTLEATGATVGPVPYSGEGESSLPDATDGVSAVAPVGLPAPDLQELEAEARYHRDRLARHHT